MYEEALIEFQKEREISKGAHAWTEAYIGWTYVEIGKPDEAQNVLDNLLERSKQEHISPFIFACLHFVLGKNDECFELLSKAYEQQDKWLCFLRIHPLFASVRSDPRYIALLHKMNSMVLTELVKVDIESQLEYNGTNQGDRVLLARVWKEVFKNCFNFSPSSHPS